MSNEKFLNNQHKKYRVFKKIIYCVCCFAGKWGYHRQGSCQAGLGAAIAEVSE